MFIVFLNALGAGMALVAGFFGWLLHRALGKPDDYAFMLLVGLIAITEDLVCRVIMRNKEKSILLALIGARSGGQIFFVPIWVWGFLLAIGRLFDVLDKIADLWSKIIFW